MPVQRATTAAISSSVTSSRSSRGTALLVGQPLLLCAQPALELGQAAVAQLGGAVEVVGALGLLDLAAQLLELLAHALEAADRLALGLPLGRHRVGLRAQLRELLAQDLQALLGGGVVLLAQRRLLDLQARDPARDLVELGRHRVDLGADDGAGLVDEVDRLVGQEAVGDVARRQRRRRDERRVLDLHPVVDLEALAQPAQDRDRVLQRRLVDDDRLEAALERGVLLDRAVLAQRRRADAVQLAAGEHRLEHVAGVHRALGRAGADDGVQLVDEQQDPALGRLDLGEHRLQALLELAAVLRARDERAHVQREDRLVLQALGDVLAHDPLGEPLDDRGLADAGIADEHGVVLRLARQDLDDAADLGVAPDDRVEPARCAPRRRGRGRTSRAPRRPPRASRSSRAARRGPGSAPRGSGPPTARALRAPCPRARASAASPGRGARRRRTRPSGARPPSRRPRAASRARARRARHRSRPTPTRAAATRAPS